MRWYFIFAFCAIAFFEIYAANYMYVKEDELAVYQDKKRKLYEKPIHFLKIGEKVKILEAYYTKVKIENDEGKIGWVDRKGLERKGATAIAMEEVKVYGFLEHVEPIYILDFEDVGFKPIRVAKDFIYDPAFMKNINREDFEWENEIYYYKDYDFKPEAVKKKSIK
jgi:hypothetical protein